MREQQQSKQGKVARGSSEEEGDTLSELFNIPACVWVGVQGSIERAQEDRPEEL